MVYGRDVCRRGNSYSTGERGEDIVLVIVHFFVPAFSWPSAGIVRVEADEGAVRALALHPHP